MALLLDTVSSISGSPITADGVDVKTEVVVEPPFTTIADAMFIQQSSSKLVSNSEETMAEETQTQLKRTDSEEKCMSTVCIYQSGIAFILNI